MAKYNAITTVTLIAGAALADGDLYRVVKINSAGRIVKASANTDKSVGVIMEGGTRAVGDRVPVALLTGIVPIKAGGAITAGQQVVADADGAVTGEAIAAAATANRVLGVALSSAASGEVAEVLCSQSLIG